MVHQNYQRVNQQIFFAHNSRKVAGVRFGDTLRSIRGPDGILRRAGAIAWDAGVIERAAAAGVTRLMVQIRGGSIYTTTMETLLAHGQLQYRDGRQWVLSLRYWSVNGAEPQAAQPAAQPAIHQLTLFEETDL
jgi:hypothetical protein